MTTNQLELPSPQKPRFAESFRELRKAQKGKKGVPLYTLYINRPAGRVIAAALRNTPFQPNHVTFTGAVITYGALLWLAFGAGSGGGFALVGLALAVGFILDSADGQLARLQGRSSKLGEWLDHVLDSGRIVLLHGAVFCFLLRATTVPPLWLAVLCGSFLFANSAIFFAGALLDQLNRQPTPGQRGHNPDKGKTELRSVLTLPVDYGISCLVMATVPWTGVFIPAYATLALCHCLFAGAFAVKSYRTLARMG
ncbi:phosphatidylglycerophosphate synthase [Arthrobacter sp. B3I9]|uniref:CDP-alcohol phosphatidyltransferase family protein n=1 Tax=Arthrobacter sp. B3I9 TaxID=3042270 RepID=UPI00278FA302|nr:CDP-alcohol phosphatidyltransferase family protein [Arthrobacter sp. B3I9]MDQ0848578.1 phosphatidylglycerophosphate synthase [Arthrobacter sp. B3I9]